VYEETLPSGEKLTDVINRTNVRTLFISLSLNVQFIIIIIMTVPKRKLNITVYFGRKMLNISLESNLAKMLLQIQTLKMQVLVLFVYLFMSLIPMHIQCKKIYSVNPLRNFIIDMIVVIVKVIYLT